ncbi:hypothetical protein ACA910_015456 [Epithemia clementina (nom. ined.)]
MSMGRYCMVQRFSTTAVGGGGGDDDLQQQQQQHSLTITPGCIHESEYEVKKSKFIGYAKHVQSWDDALSFLNDIKAQHPKARHWCYGFRTGGLLLQQQSGVEKDDSERDGGRQSALLSERCSDDGEPTGTAGAPILGAIQGQGLTNVICVVVRYFGGIKLGAGGLIRAYGASARQVLREAEPNYQVVIPTTQLSVTVPASHVGDLYKVLSSLGSDVSGDESTYGVDGSFTLTVQCVSDKVDAFTSALLDATRGQASIL